MGAVTFSFRTHELIASVIRESALKKGLELKRFQGKDPICISLLTYFSFRHDATHNIPGENLYINL